MEVDGAVIGSIGKGLVVLLAVARDDDEKAADWLLDRITGLRIFEDADGKMNLSVTDVEGGLLIVSQFTLYGDTRKGRRPSFDQAAPAAEAKRLYDYFVEAARGRNLPVGTGIFQADMQVHLINDGPVTLICDSPSPNRNGG